MIWYNPSTWGRGSNFQEHLSTISETNDSFYCASPYCRKKITEDRMAYETSTGEVVHRGECQETLIVHKVFTSGDVEMGNFDFISQEKASKLKRRGKISKTCLEKK